MTADAYVELERLHGEWSDTTDELEQIMAQWRVNWGDSQLRDRYYEKQDLTQKLVQEIMILKRKLGA